MHKGLFILRKCIFSDFGKQKQHTRLRSSHTGHLFGFLLRFLQQPNTVGNRVKKMKISCLIIHITPQNQMILQGFLLPTVVLYQGEYDIVGTGQPNRRLSELAVYNGR